MRRWIYAVIAVIILGFSVAEAVGNRNVPEYDVSEQGIKELNILFSYSEEGWIEEQPINYWNQEIDYKSLFSSSELVAKVRFTGDRRAEKMVLNSDVEIIELYKGEGIAADETVRIFEYVTAYTHQYLMIEDGYMPLLPDREYLVFLQRCPYPEEKPLSEEEKRTYLYTNVYFGKFSLGGQVILSYEEERAAWENEKLKYKDIMEVDFIAEDSARLNKYCEIREEAFKGLL